MNRVPNRFADNEPTTTAGDNDSEHYLLRTDTNAITDTVDKKPKLHTFVRVNESVQTATGRLNYEPRINLRHLREFIVKMLLLCRNASLNN